MIAPFSQSGQAVTQTPSYQHSSGYNIIGGLPFSGFGANMSMTHISTQLLQPLQTSSLNMIGWFGVTMLGNIRISSCANFHSFRYNPLWAT